MPHTMSSCADWLNRLAEPPKRYTFADGSEYFGEVKEGQIHGQVVANEG